MKLAFSKPTSNEAEQRVLFSGFRSIGYEGLQLKAGQYEPYLQRPEAFLQEWGDDHGAVSGLIFGGALDEGGIAALRRLLDFGAAVGTERIVFCHGHPRQGLERRDIEGFARILTDLGEECQQRDVRLSLHHHYNQPVMLRDDFRWFFDAARPDTVGLTLDTAHLAKSGIEDIGAIIREFGTFIDNVHLKDYAEGEFRVLGQGTIDFAPVVDALSSIDYDGWLCADEESGSDLVSAMEICHRFMRKSLADSPSLS